VGDAAKSRGITGKAIAFLGLGEGSALIGKEGAPFLIFRI